MYNRILLPLDRSALAECVLPHAIAVARAFESQVTLLNVMDMPREERWRNAMDPLNWQIHKAEAKTYLHEMNLRLQAAGLLTETHILEGFAAEQISEFSDTHAPQLIILSSHGQSGLSGWNVSGVVLKVVLRARTSIMIVRAAQPVAPDVTGLRYQRILVPLDGTQRAEYILPAAATLARARRIDERLASEYPHLSGVRPASRLATAILMYSFGGLRRAGEGDGEPIATGVTEPELLAAVIGPDLDSLTAQSALKALREECLFHNFDGVRYFFKMTHNVTQLLEQEFDNVKQEEAEAKIKEELEQQLASRPAYVWPIDSMRVDDRKPQFALVYLPLEFASWGQARQDQYALDILLKSGDQPRRYRNALGLAVPNLQEIESLRRAMRYTRAVELLRGKKSQLNLTTEQMAQLKERGDTEKGKVISAFRNLYNAVWLPTASNGNINLEVIDIGARPLGATTIHERLMELLTTVHNKVYGKLLAHKLLEYMRLGEFAPDHASRPLGISTNQVVDAFYENLGFPRLVDDKIIRRAIAQGVKESYFGYVGRGDRVAADKIREGSDYFVPRAQVVFSQDLREDEIDLGSGFIVLPAAIEPEAATPPVDVSPEELGTQTGAPPVVPLTQPVEKKAPAVQTHVALRLRLTRAQLYASFNALANLAEKAGTVEVVVTADSMAGFDPVWLRNAVQEPLEEAGAEIIRGESQNG